MSIDKYRHEVPLKSGVAEFLSFKEKGIRMGCNEQCTGYGSNFVLDSLDIRSYFGVVATAWRGGSRKTGAGYLSESSGGSGRTAEKCLVLRMSRRGYSWKTGWYARRRGRGRISLSMIPKKRIS